MNLTWCEQVFALDCPLLKDGSALSWANAFSKYHSEIFRAKVTDVHFVGMDEWPVYSITYEVEEVLKGNVPNRIVANFVSWCDACDDDSAKDLHQDMIGKEFVVQGRLMLNHISWSFQPDWCWGFVQLPFRWAQGDLLTALRDHERRRSP